ncbi:MAG: isoleucine--tRNA ligase [Candidatus Babeliales bacterium]
MATDKAETTVSFKDTLNLPRTDFPLRANTKTEDPAMIKRWEQQELFSQSTEHNKGHTKFILHDGPPYANGHIHLGHAYNKILKDIVTKSQRMMGKHVPVIPGWDCHGLPIEFKVAQDNPGLSPQEMKKACRAYAQQWIDVQRSELKQLGVLMDWDHPYITMSPGYEAATLRAFGIFVANGYIERKNKTVPWCFHDQTVLASAEIEYHERKDPSIYVLFELVQSFTDQLFPDFAGKSVNFLVWTTTPWTLPLNRAVLIRPSTEYAIVETGGTYFIIAQALIEKFASLLQREYQVIATINSDTLLAAHPKIQHPFIDDLKVPLIADKSVLLEDGTALVHCAPGCGPEDYEVGVRNSLEIFSPVGPDGRYTAGIAPQELEGMLVTDGQIWVIKKLAERGRMLYKGSIKHSYPHCWRCRNGLIFRATRQWFCNLSQGDLKQRALTVTDTINTVPEKSINRLKATIEGRLEWVLSRQRVWGVPIPALLCTKCDYTYITQGLIERVAEGVEQEGIEYWDSVEVEQLLPKGFACPLCTTTVFKKEYDILDVWFDSGISHYAVLRKNPELQFPADMYIEGKDQHRGWFQSSLLTALVIEGVAPMRTIVTHGYTVDAQGRKMSKSLGNGVDPQDIINQLGTDGLRLWASSIDNSGDVVVSDVLLKNVGQVAQKIRNTCRFLLQNLYDYDHTRDAVPFDQLLLIDRHALEQLVDVQATVMRNYANVDFTGIFHVLGDYCAVDLSAAYLDIIKDRLYVEKAAGLKRRSAQTVCWYILDTLTRLMAPILSFTAEQISDYYQKDKQQSIHMQQFAPLTQLRHFFETQMLSEGGEHITTTHALLTEVPAAYNFDAIQAWLKSHEQQWVVLKDLRSALLKAIEGMREKGIIKHSLEARLTIYMDMALRNSLAPFFVHEDTAVETQKSFLKEFLIVSQLEFAPSAQGLTESMMTGLFVQVEHALGRKCPRCWNWDEFPGEHDLCRRCQGVLR